MKSDFTQISVNALTSLDSPKTFGQLVIAARGDALVRLADVSQKIELGPQTSDTSSVFDGLKAVFIGIYGTPEANPLTVIDGVRALVPSIQQQLPPGLNATIAYDSTEVHPRLDPRGRQDAHRGGGDRHRHHLPVPRQPALDLHPDRHHSAVADRRDDRAAGARLFDQPLDAARARARHRPRGRRCDRGGREHPPPYRGRHDAVRRLDPRRPRDRAAGRRDDHHARRGLRADRLRQRRHRRAVPRIRLHARGRGHRLGLHRAHALADDVLEASAARSGRPLVRPVRRRQPSTACAGPISGGCIRRSTSAR